MNRTVWAVAVTAGVAGTSFAGPPGRFGHFGGYAPGGFFGLNLEFGSFGYGHYGRGVGVSLTIPLFPAPSCYDPPLFYSQPVYPPGGFGSSAFFFRSPAATPGGAFFLPEFTDPEPPRNRWSRELPAPSRTSPAPPRAVPADPPSFSPFPPRAPVPDTFRYDGGPANPVPQPAPDVRPPAPVPDGEGLKVSLPGRGPKAGYRYPVYGEK